MKRSNVDTDQIIPKQFLKKVERTGFGKHLFHDWRFNEDGTDNAEFELNKPVFKGANILVVGDNFGCGSSREHAPLAIKAAGVRVIIAESFARIFYRNAFNIGLPLLESVEASTGLSDGERGVVDLADGRIEGVGGVFQAKPIPDFMAQLIAAGGLVEYVRTMKVGR